jgi:hypothetical protein
VKLRKHTRHHDLRPEFPAWKLKQRKRLNAGWFSSSKRSLGAPEFLDEAGVELAPWVCYLEKPLPTGFEPAQEEWKSFQDLQICFQSLDE